MNPSDATPTPSPSPTLKTPFIAFALPKPGMEISPEDCEPQLVVLSWKFATIPQPRLLYLLNRVDAVVKALEKWATAAKEIIKTSVEGADSMKVGDQKILEAEPGALIPVFTKRERTGLDSEKIKEEMGEAWYAAHCKTTEYFELRFKKPGT